MKAPKGLKVGDRVKVYGAWTCNGKFAPDFKGKVHYIDDGRIQLDIDAPPRGDCIRRAGWTLVPGHAEGAIYGCRKIVRLVPRRKAGAP